VAKCEKQIRFRDPLKPWHEGALFHEETPKKPQAEKMLNFSLATEKRDAVQRCQVAANGR